MQVKYNNKDIDAVLPYVMSYGHFENEDAAREAIVYFITHDVTKDTSHRQGLYCLCVVYTPSGHAADLSIQARALEARLRPTPFQPIPLSKEEQGWLEEQERIDNE